MWSEAKSAQGLQRAVGWRVILVCLTFLFMAPAAQAEDAYQIKAAFIYNFTKFVTWPVAVEQQGGDLRLCLFNENPFGDYVYLLDGRKVRNFYLRVQQPRTVAELSQCHILFLTPGKSNGSVLSSVAGLPVLTIADHTGFVEQGGAIELLSEDNRIRFDVNLQRIKDGGLDISSKLLHLARQVR